MSGTENELIYDLISRHQFGVMHNIVLLKIDALKCTYNCEGAWHANVLLHLRQQNIQMLMSVREQGIANMLISGNDLMFATLPSYMVYSKDSEPLAFD